MKYVSGIKQNIHTETENPTESFIGLLCSDVYQGRLTAPVLEMLKSVTKNAFREYISDTVKSRLSNALQMTTEEERSVVLDIPSVPDDEVITTEEEIEGFMIIKAIVREVIPADRIIMRDAKIYCAVLIDNNNRRPLARMHFNQAQKRIGLFDEGSDKKVDIQTIDDIYGLKDRIKATASQYV